MVAVQKFFAAVLVVALAVLPLAGASAAVRMSADQGPVSGVSAGYHAGCKDAMHGKAHSEGLASTGAETHASSQKHHCPMQGDCDSSCVCAGIAIPGLLVVAPSLVMVSGAPIQNTLIAAALNARTDVPPPPPPRV